MVADDKPIFSMAARQLASAVLIDPVGGAPELLQAPAFAHATPNRVANDFVPDGACKA